MLDFKNSNFILKEGDSVELLKLIPENSIDCLVTDPPYSTISGGTPDNPEVKRPKGILESNDGKIFELNDLPIENWIGEAYRIMKDRSHIYVMVNMLNLLYYAEEITKAGFLIHNILIWKKNNVTPSRWYMKNAEYIIFARKGEAKPINNMGSKMILEHNNVTDRIHPTEKPVSLMQELILNSSSENDIILDPFIGSGSTIEAALISNRKAIGFELDKKYYDLSFKRISNIDLKKNKVIEQKKPRLTKNQQIILNVLKENPNQEFTAKELSSITGLNTRTCSGCITPLYSYNYIIKIKNKSPISIKIKN